MPLFRACPNCGSQIHVRKLACPCGHSVFRGSKPLTTRNASRKSDVGAARALETDEQTAKRRKSDRKRVRETRALETEEQTAKRRKSDRKRVRETRALETKQQTAKRRKSNREHVRETRVLQNVQIVGVPQLHSYNACLQCKARVEPLTPPLRRCSKHDCGMIQRTTRPCMPLATPLEKLLMWTGKLLLLIYLPQHHSRQSPTIRTRTLSLGSPGSECSPSDTMRFSLILLIH